MRRRLSLLFLLSLFVLCGCAATLPSHRDRPVSLTRAAPPGTPITEIARRVGLEEDATAAWPLPDAVFALDARIAAIERATTSVDTQTYLLSDDRTGREVLRALRDAAARGVRVRLLVDDFGTAGLDSLLMGLAAEPNVEVRLFNPFVAGRCCMLPRLLALAGDFDRLNHRMHNKLFIADGAFAIVGGRNLADGYFLRSSEGNFFDLEVSVVGAIVPALGRSFDRYWNSAHAYDVREIVSAGATADVDDPGLRVAFERRTAADAATAHPEGVDPFGAPALSESFASGRFRFLPVTAASTYADPLEKVNGSLREPAALETVADLFLAGLDESRDEVVLFSPYFIPGPELMKRLRELRSRGVAVRVVTNSLAVSDRPVANIALERHQRELLAAGVELLELSSERIRHDRQLRALIGSSTGRLHAKMALVDRRTVYLGSLNLDPRSSSINTEIGVRLESPELASMLWDAFRVEEAAGVYRVRLAADGRTLAWSILNGSRQEEALEEEPDANWWRQLTIRLLSIFVPEGQL